jgi:capsular polysaccharide biosynthesis protein
MSDIFLLLIGIAIGVGMRLCLAFLDVAIKRIEKNE